MKMILVDDEEIAVNALKRRVNWEKYGVSEVYTAGSMQQAMEIFQKDTIDFILCDIEMPNGSGLELLEWIKIYYPKTECVYVTCHSEFKYMRKAMQLGSVDYILKPIDYEELDQILTSLTKRMNDKVEVEKIADNIMMRIVAQEVVKPCDETVSKVKKYILEHIQETIYIEDVAKSVFLNEQYLMRLFKKSTGLSILEFITGERLELAKELLKSTDYPVNKVANCVGYGHYSYFTKIFKRSTGCSPIKYRQQFVHNNEI